MNQKLRTARSGIVILFAILCIVCLSLSLAFSASFAAYAAEGDGATLPDSDGTHDLWQVHYTVQEEDESGNVVEREKVESLWDGIRNDQPISYLDTQNDDGVRSVVLGTEDDLNCFAPFRGEGVELTLKLNPDYEIEGQKLGDLYDLSNASYLGNKATGEATYSYIMPTSVVVPSKTEGADSLELHKNWTIVTLCNSLINAPKGYGDRGYAMPSNHTLVKPVLGNTVVYHIKSTTVYDEMIAVTYVSDTNKEYYNVYIDGEENYNVTTDEWDKDEIGNAAAAENADIVNYLIRRLPALEAADGKYTLTIVAVSVTTDEGIYYAQTTAKYDFNVIPQSLGDNTVSDSTFDANFTYDIGDAVVEYTEDNQWIDSIGFELYLGKKNEAGAIKLVSGVDYDLKNADNVTSVGLVNLVIVGKGNFRGEHTVSNRVRVTPAVNKWDVMPNIITWTYGTYKPSNNLIVGKPILIDNDEDITFRIVRLVKHGDVVNEEVIEELSNIHYSIDPNTGKSTGIVNNEIAAILEKLDAGNYRLYASVYGANVADPKPDRNYLALSEDSVDFTIFAGINSWKAGVEPTVKDGGWVTGKLDSVEGLINAESEFGTPILMIYDMNDNLIYSNLSDHENTVYGDINVLKTLKAGRYYLSAEVKGTSNYAGLKTNVFFTVSPNNLPVWAVILIVVGSLGIVALVFAILHQKGILQMLTGKVIVSMRTRANVDATLAAIRAAKVAREAEASIAAAKAREAEEAKAKKTEEK